MSPLHISKYAMHGTNTNIGHAQYKKKLLFSLDTGISTASPVSEDCRLLVGLSSPILALHNSRSTMSKNSNNMSRIHAHTIVNYSSLADQLVYTGNSQSLEQLDISIALLQVGLLNTQHISYSQISNLD